MAIRETETLPPTVIPETRGTYHVTFCEDADSPHGVGVGRSPVLAWCVTGSIENGDVTAYADPVVADGLPDNPSCYEEVLPDGSRQWRFPHDCTLDTWDAVLVYAAEKLDAYRQHRERLKAKKAAIG
jgi:hypothetical protein